MYHRFTWTQIKEAFGGEWVELVDCQWDWNRPYPKWARVRCHAADRFSLLNEIQAHGSREDSVIMHVGVTDYVIAQEFAATL